MPMKLFKFLLFISLLVSLNASARERTPNEIRQEALNVLILKHPQQRRAQTLNFNDMKELKRMDNLSIVGLEDFGFAVISHDDCFDAVLGYSFTALSDTLPCGFEWWLEEMNLVLQQSSESEILSNRVNRTDDHCVSPLMTSRWGQEEPYNNKCFATANEKTRKFATGCIATALSQLLYYYKYPSHGVGSKTYTINYTNWAEITFSSDFENSYYDWNNMLDGYSGEYSDVQADAVATLMYDCAIATNTKFNTNSSSSTTSEMVNALTQYFDYDEGTALYERSNYSNDEWMDMIYNEMDNKRPILYTGKKSSSSSGHAFVLHGYNSEGLVYINWGWDGRYDGYYKIDKLNVNNTNYNSNQSMVLTNCTKTPSDGTEHYVLSINITGRGSVCFNKEILTDYSGSFVFNTGETIVLSFVPQSEYQIKSVFINDVDVTTSIENNSYTITNMSQNVSVAVEFSKKTWYLNIESRGGGYTKYNGEIIRNETKTFPISKGEYIYSYFFKFYPDEGEELVKVLVNNKDVTWSSSISNSYDYITSGQNVSLYVEFSGGSTGFIQHIKNEENVSKFYTLDGQRIEVPRKGVNIVVRSDGTVKKIVVK